MWYLLLVLVSADQYGADNVYATQAECAATLATEYRGEGACVGVNLTVIELPKSAPITVTVLPEMGSTE